MREKMHTTTILALEKRIAELRQQSAPSFGEMPWSEARFERIAPKIRKMFGGNTEATAEALEIVQRMFRDERQAMMMQLTARKILNSEGTIMNLKEHLKSAFESAAAHHVAAATSHGQMAKSCAAMADHVEKSDSVLASHHRDMSTQHQALSDSHTDAAEKCLACHKSVDEIDASELDGRGDGEGTRLKVLVDRLEKLIVPTNVSAINLHPDAGPARKITPIPRAGSPAIDQKDLDKIPVELHQLLRTQ